MANELWTRKEVAAIFGVIPHTIYFWEKAGVITPSLHVRGRPRYSIEDIEKAAQIKPAIIEEIPKIPV